jgi:hypothetical protein
MYIPVRGIRSPQTSMYVRIHHVMVLSSIREQQLLYCVLCVIINVYMGTLIDITLILI